MRDGTSTHAVSARPYSPGSGPRAGQERPTAPPRRSGRGWIPRPFRVKRQGTIHHPLWPGGAEQPDDVNTMLSTTLRNFTTLLIGLLAAVLAAAPARARADAAPVRGGTLGLHARRARQRSVPHPGCQAAVAQAAAAALTGPRSRVAARSFSPPMVNLNLCQQPACRRRQRAPGRAIGPKRREWWTATSSVISTISCQ